MVMIKPRDRQMTSYPFRFHCWATDLCTHVSAVPIYFRPHMSHILSWVFVSNGHGKAKRSADDVTSFQVSSRYRPLCTHTSAVHVSFLRVTYSRCLRVFILFVCVCLHTHSAFRVLRVIYFVCILPWLLMLSFFYTCFGSLSDFVFMIQCFDVLWCKEG